MTWFLKDEGYELFFNRDERKTRSRAKAPTTQNQSGINYIAPTDTDAGGTWIATNHFGITVCLLNYYQFEKSLISQPSNTWISRGEIVRDFAVSTSLAEADTKIESLKLSNYRAFRLFIIDRKGNNRLYVWDGKQLQIELAIDGPRSSSSIDTQQVKASRYQLYADLKLADSTNREDYLSYHASHMPNKSAQSVCMHRDDANTVSLSHIEVSDDATNFSYADGPPCSVKLEEPIVLSLI